MHIHSNQTIPNIHLDAMYAAEKDAVRREVERTRKKLMESASKLEGEACEVRLGAREEESGKEGEQEPENPRDRETQKNEASSNDEGKSISDWA